MSDFDLSGPQEKINELKYGKESWTLIKKLRLQMSDLAFEVETLEARMDEKDNDIASLSACLVDEKDRHCASLEEAENLIQRYQATITKLGEELAKFKAKLARQQDHHIEARIETEEENSKLWYAEHERANAWKEAAEGLDEAASYMPEWDSGPPPDYEAIEKLVDYARKLEDS